MSLEKEKEKRYQSAGELRSELENIEKGMPTTDRVIPERKPLTSKEITVTFGLKKLLVPALALAAVVIIAVVIWQPWSKKAPTPLPSDKPSLAVVYFENNTGDEELDYWRKALAELLITDLSQSKYIHVLSRDRLFNILENLNLMEAKSFSSEDLKQVASRSGVRNILQGAYTKAGETVRIDIMLQEATSGELIASESVEGIGLDNIFTLVDELTRRIKTSLKLSQEEIASDLDKRVKEITTSSPEAYKYFSEGLSYELKGNQQEAIRSYEKAIEIDPDFALAYNYLAWTYQETGYYSEAKKHMGKAFELRDQVSDREQYIIEGDYYNLHSVHDKAIEAYRKLLMIYPDDWAGNMDLGVVYIETEQWDKAIERFEFLKQNKDDPIWTYFYLSGLYSAKGLFDKSREVIEYYINNLGEHRSIIRESIYNYLDQGKLDLALFEAEKALRLYPTDYKNLYYLGDVHTFRGELEEAEKQYLKLLESGEKSHQSWGRDNLAYLYLLQGRFEESKDQMRKQIAIGVETEEIRWITEGHAYLGFVNLKQGNLDEARIETTKAIDAANSSEELVDLQRRSFRWKGRLYAKEKKTEEANKIAEELKKKLEEGVNKKFIRNYYFLKSTIEIEEGNFSKAIEYVEKGLPLAPYGPLGLPAWAIDNLAFAHYSLGNLEKARIEYERIAKLTRNSGRLKNGDIYAKSFYMLGKIYEEQGDTAKAIEHYEKFLDLWKDADPGIAEVEDAKKKLAGLKGE